MNYAKIHTEDQTKNIEVFSKTVLQVRIMIGEAVSENQDTKNE